MNSCLYRARVMHHRLEPKDFRFHYHVFMFYIDLDELEMLTKKIWFISRNKFNVFNFRDKDHLQLPKENPDKTKSTKEHILEYLNANGVKLKNPKIMLMTNLCTLGYQFNPVSFYFCYDLIPPRLQLMPGGEEKQDSKSICCIAEISNTFREMKPFFIGEECFDGTNYHLNTAKYFYVSPFIEHDAHFDFNVEVPGEKLTIRIDSLTRTPAAPERTDKGEGTKNNKRIFISTLTGTRKDLTNARLFWYALRFPFITLQVIGLIHWNAFKLWLKKIRYFKKNEHKDLQREVFKRYGN